ncbi:carbon-nitrogen hydrolase family protein [candidate division TA06 bacterium]|nr:carbon-nitrogen hydrolase family protein [candidate division TA06 bacterium]
MKIGTFQFAGSHNIENNYLAIIRGINKAVEQNVEVLLMQECALCGYYEQMIKDESIYDLKKQDTYQEKIQQAIDKTNITLIFGRVQKWEHQIYNAVAILHKNKNCSYYAKRALWGWDKNNFSRGTEKGFFNVGNIRYATRICYETEFPEYFRELFNEKIPIALISYAYTGHEDDLDKYDLTKGHLRTRALENSIFVVSANDISRYQLGPTAIINPSGRIVKIASRTEEELLVFDYEDYPMTFGRQGIIENSEYVLKKGK